MTQEKLCDLVAPLGLILRTSMVKRKKIKYFCSSQKLKAKINDYFVLSQYHIFISQQNDSI